MTDQEIFDKVVRHVIEQGKKSRNETRGGTCRYLSDDGSKCAAGCLIKDGMYQPEMDRWTMLAGELQRTYPDAVEYNSSQSKMVRALQIAHDQAVEKDDTGNISSEVFVSNFKTIASAIGTALGLSTDACW